MLVRLVLALAILLAISPAFAGPVPREKALVLAKMIHNSPAEAQKRLMLRVRCACLFGQVVVS